MTASESIAAIAFYAGLAAFAGGAIVGARGAVERKPARIAIPLLVLGALGIAAALLVYANGPRRMLPF